MSSNPGLLERAVFVEVCDSGWDPQAIVKQLVWCEGSVHEEITVFSSLRKALAYAREAFASENGPHVSSGGTTPVWSVMRR